MVFISEMRIESSGFSAGYVCLYVTPTPQFSHGQAGRAANAGGWQAGANQFICGSFCRRKKGNSSTLAALTDVCRRQRPTALHGGQSVSLRPAVEIPSA